jgi:hypothetical protein
MRIEQIAADVADRLAGRMLRRALLAVAIAVLALAATCQFTDAGLLALTVSYGAIKAALIVGAIYAALALCGVIYWVVQGRAVKTSLPASGRQGELQLIMLLEALMLGYTMARRREPTS